MLEHDCHPYRLIFLLLSDEMRELFLSSSYAFFKFLIN